MSYSKVEASERESVRIGEISRYRVNSPRPRRLAPPFCPIMQAGGEQSQEGEREH